MRRFAKYLLLPPFLSAPGASIHSDSAVFDSFRGSGSLDGRTPPVHPEGVAGSWSVVSGTSTLQSDHLEGSFPSTSNTMAVLNFGTSNVELFMSFRLPSTGTNRSAAVAAWVVDGLNFVHLRAKLDDGTARIISVNNNVFTNRANALYSFAADTDYALRLNVDGGVFTGTFYEKVGGVWTPLTMSSGSNPLVWDGSASGLPVTTNAGIRMTNTVGGGNVSIYEMTGDFLVDESVAIAATPVITSSTKVGLSFVDNPSTWSEPGWADVITALSDKVGVLNTHIYPFGLLDSWASDTGGKTEATPSLWDTGNRLGNALTKMRALSATADLVLTLYSAPWFIKSVCGSSGASTPLTYADRFSDDGRVTQDGLSDWGLYVDGAVEKAAAAGVRFFQVWNEMKGFYFNPEGQSNRWDVDMDAGSGNQANMGFSYFYDYTANRIVAKMAALGYTRNEYQIAGPYPVLSMRGAKTSSSIPVGHPLYTYGTTWGYANSAPFNALDAFLDDAATHGFELDALAIDMSTYLQDGAYPTDDAFQLTQKFGVVIDYCRDRLEVYGFSRDMPIVFSEIYAFPTPTNQGTTGVFADEAVRQAYRAAIKADVMAQCILGGVLYPLHWGPIGSAEGSNYNDGGWVSDPAGGTSALKRWGEVAGYFHTHFSSGTDIYAVTAANGKLGGIASATQVLLWNKTPDAIDAEVEGVVHTFSAYETKLVAR